MGRVLRDGFVFRGGRRKSSDQVVFFTSLLGGLVLAACGGKTELAQRAPSDQHGHDAASDRAPSTEDDSAEDSAADDALVSGDRLAGGTIPAAAAATSDGAPVVGSNPVPAGTAPGGADAEPQVASVETVDDEVVDSPSPNRPPELPALVPTEVEVPPSAASSPSFGEAVADLPAEDPQTEAPDEDAALELEEEVPPPSEPPTVPRPAEPGVWGDTLPPEAEGAPAAAPFSGCATIEWLGGDISVKTMSADGTTLIGNAGPVQVGGEGAGAAFRWRRSEAIEWFEDGLRLEDVSADGSWIAATLVDSDAREVPVLIGPDGGVQVLAGSGEAVAVSADGSIVVGSGTEEPSDERYYRPAFRWSATTGVESLPRWSHPEGELAWSPTDVSADGSIVVGSGGVPGSLSSFTLKWSAAAGLASLPGGSLPVISADGSLAVFMATGGRYAGTVGGTLVATNDSVDLGFPSPSSPGSSSSVATCVNPDGSIVFGTGESTSARWSDVVSPEAYVWRQDVGTQPLAEVLADSCVDLAAIPAARWEVRALSADARLLVACAALEEQGYCWLAAWP